MFSSSKNIYNVFIVFLFFHLATTVAVAQVQVAVGISRCVTAGGTCGHVYNYNAPLTLMAPNNSSGELSSLINNPPANVYTSSCTPNIQMWDYCTIHPDPDCTNFARGVGTSCPGWASGPGVWGCMINGGISIGIAACAAMDDNITCASWNGSWGSMPNGNWFDVNTGLYDGWYVSQDLLPLFSGYGCGTMYSNAQHNISGNYNGGGQFSMYGCW